MSIELSATAFENPAADHQDSQATFLPHRVKQADGQTDGETDGETDPRVVSQLHKQMDHYLLAESKVFAEEDRAASWFCLISTLVPLMVCVAVAAFSDYMFVRLSASILTGMLIVRMFILYHDFKHNAIFKGSFIAGCILDLYGYLLLSPPGIWKSSHDHHHKHNSKLFGSSIGSFPIMTTTDYAKATAAERFEYRFARHSLVIFFGYFTAFFWGMCVRTIYFKPSQTRSSLIALTLHFGLIAASLWWLGWLTTFFVIFLPVFLATGVGAYLFYVQHNFPAAIIRDTNEWTYAGAALQSSSFVEMSPMMHWFTGNIGYHHVHHLNSKIPFYRLPEAMAALPQLQSPGTTTFGLKDIVACLRLKLWNVEENRFVPFPVRAKA